MKYFKTFVPILKMKLFTFCLVLKSGNLQEIGTFYEEMTKFKAGLSERPQTYRKIEVSVVTGSCLAECPNRIWVSIRQSI